MPDDENPKPKPKWKVSEMLLTCWNHEKVRVWKSHRQFTPPRYRVVNAAGNVMDVRESDLLRDEDVTALKSYFKSGKLDDLKGIVFPRRRIW